jgi:hypothetical protein
LEREHSQKHIVAMLGEKTQEIRFGAAAMEWFGGSAGGRMEDLEGGEVYRIR